MQGHQLTVAEEAWPAKGSGSVSLEIGVCDLGGYDCSNKSHI